MPDVIFQASDLSGTKRRDFLDAARSGRAQLRDTDGKSIVALPAGDLEVLEQLAKWSAEHRKLHALLDSGTPITVQALGSLAWLRAFDRDDLRAFADELQEVLIIAMAENDAEPIRAAIHAWRVTASELEDPVRRDVLTGRFDTRNFLEAGQSGDA